MEDGLAHTIRLMPRGKLQYTARTLKVPAGIATLAKLGSVIYITAQRNVVVPPSPAAQGVALAKARAHPCRPRHCLLSTGSNALPIYFLHETCYTLRVS